MTLDDVSTTKAADFITVKLHVSSLGRALRSQELEGGRVTISYVGDL